MRGVAAITGIHPSGFSLEFPGHVESTGPTEQIDFQPSLYFQTNRSLDKAALTIWNNSGERFLGQAPSSGACVSSGGICTGTECIGPSSGTSVHGSDASDAAL